MTGGEQPYSDAAPPSQVDGLGRDAPGDSGGNVSDARPAMPCSGHGDSGAIIDYLGGFSKWNRYVLVLSCEIACGLG